MERLSNMFQGLSTGDGTTANGTDLISKDFSLTHEFMTRLELDVEKALNRIKKIANYEFRNKALLARALLSKNFNQKKREIHETGMSYQSLILVGDHVLRLLIIKALIAESHVWDKDIAERLNRSLTSLISSSAMTFISIKTIGLDEFVFVEAKTDQDSLQNACEAVKDTTNIFDTKKKSFLSDVFKALFGAIYLDTNMELTDVKPAFDTLFSEYIKQVVQHYKL